MTNPNVKSISVFGLGYVGTVTAACFAHLGYKVIGVDLNATKVEAINAGRSPIVEPKLSDLVASSHSACRLHASSDLRTAVLETDISFLCVGTPSLRSGKLDLGHVGPVCRDIGHALREKNSFHLVVLRSTVLPGTAETLVIPTLEHSSGKKFGKDFGVCVNPEFMREGTAVDDFMQPTMTVIGAAEQTHSSALMEIYSWAPGRIFQASFRSAEMAKYICNAWHAVKVAFANEIGSLAKELGVDTEEAVEVFLADNKLNISPAYLKPGFAFGGSCLPKDVRALAYRAKEVDVKLPLFEAVLPSNQTHLERAEYLVRKTGKRRITMLGLSFKAGTDDLRESPQVQLIKHLLGEGCEIKIWDENVSLGRLIGSNRQYIEEVIPHIGSLLYSSLEDAVKATDVVIVATKVDKDRLAKVLNGHTVIDLVNLDKSRRPKATAYEGICW